MMIYAIRRKSNGMFYRKEKKGYGRVDRTMWTEQASKAWLVWDKNNIWTWFARSFPYWKSENFDVADYEVVEFELKEMK